MTNDLWKRAKFTFPNVCSLAVVLLLLVIYFGVFGDLDWSWQVRMGALIVQTGDLRPPESFSYTIEGAKIHDFEWLYEVVLWVTWTTLGWGGLKFLKVIAVVMPLVLVARQLRREKVRWHASALSLFLAMAVLSPAWNLRPLFCTTIGILLVCSMLHNHCTSRRPLSWGLPIVMLLWANLHPGVIVGVGLLYGAIAWEWANQWLRWNEPLDRSSLKRLTVIGGLGVVATLLSPDPVERLLYPFSPELAHPVMRMFVEMRPLVTFIAEMPFRIGVIYGLAIVVLATAILRLRHYRLWELALLAGLTVLGNAAARGAMDWFLVMLLLGVPHIKALLSQAAHSKPRPVTVASLLWCNRRMNQLLASPLFRFQPFWPTATLAALLLISLSAPIGRDMPRHNAAEWPVAALDHMEEAGLCGRFFAPPDYGAYIGWRLGEHGKVYSDTRGFYFPPQLLEDSIYLPQLGPDWHARLDRVLDEYHTDYFLLETTGARGELWQVLKAHVGAPLFLDEQSVVLSATQVRTGITSSAPGKCLSNQ